ncbi:MAG: cytotoxic translational repressor of toxin-antitoxin stability system [Desulfovibrio sp.]|jgi:mRNA-degrading endonuclease RelE of RelBE toxin-antitoxin system|nr:cytotoxic translational repressor of toxin-antitoxin stability system [Desulfovibrio sp.]
MSQPKKRETSWQVDFGGKAEKQVKKLPPDIRDIVFYLKYRMEQDGPERTEWRNYGIIVNAKDAHHCHLSNNRPRYVAVWKVLNREEQVIEIRFVGPHGSVDYSRFK